METGEDVLFSDESCSGPEVRLNGANETSSAVNSASTPRSPHSPDGTNPKRTRKVSFPDDSCLVRTLEPFDPWKNAGTYTSKDIIDAYRSICSQLKVKPSDKLIKQLEACESFKERIDVIDLRGTKLDLKSCETLEEVLRKVRTKTLDLENTNLEDEGTLSILEMIEFYHSACRLNLAYNNKIRIRGWQALGRTIKRTPCLEYLDIRHTVWTEQSIPLLGRSLRMNCPLTILHMEATNLTGRPLYLLANAIKSNQILRDLFLGDNKLIPSDGQCIGAMLKTNNTLRLLDLRNNSLQDMGLGHICEGLAEQTEGGLQTLVLWNNMLTFQGMGFLGTALTSLKNLQTLNLGHNRLTNEGIHMLKDGLLLNQSLQRLGLLNTRLSSEGIIALAEVIADSNAMLRLDIRENDPYVGGLMALALSLKMNNSLVRIDLDKELKKEPGMETTQRILLADIYSYCQRNKSLAEDKEKQASVASGVTQGVTSSVTTGATQADAAKARNCPPKDSASTSHQKAVNLIELQELSGDMYPASSRFKITRIFEGSRAGIPDSSSGDDSSSSAEGEGLLVEIEPCSSKNISDDFSNLELFDTESDSSTSQDTDSDSRVDSYPAGGSKESLDSMGTPIRRPVRSSDTDITQENSSHHFERELDAMLANVSNQRPTAAKRELSNDNADFWLHQMDGVFKTASTSSNNANPPTGDLLGS